MTMYQRSRCQHCLRTYSHQISGARDAWGGDVEPRGDDRHCGYCLAVIQQALQNLVPVVRSRVHVGCSDVTVAELVEVEKAAQEAARAKGGLPIRRIFPGLIDQTDPENRYMQGIVRKDGRTYMYNYWTKRGGMEGGQVFIEAEFNPETGTYAPWSVTDQWLTPPTLVEYPPVDVGEELRTHDLRSAERQAPAETKKAETTFLRLVAASPPGFDDEIDDVLGPIDPETGRFLGRAAKPVEAESATPYTSATIAGFTGLRVVPDEPAPDWKPEVELSEEDRKARRKMVSRKTVATEALPEGALPVYGFDDVLVPRVCEPTPKPKYPTNAVEAYLRKRHEQEPDGAQAEPEQWYIFVLKDDPRFFAQVEQEGCFPSDSTLTVLERSYASESLALEWARKNLFGVVGGEPGPSRDLESGD